MKSLSSAVMAVRVRDGLVAVWRRIVAMVSVLALALLGVAFTASSASADPLGDAAPVTTDPVCVTHPYAVTEVNFESDLPQFDPVLGTFQSATVTAAAGLKTTVHMQNTAVQAQTVRVTSSSTLTTTGPDGDEAGLAVDVSLVFPVTRIGVGESVTAGPLEDSASSAEVSTDAARWVGTGTVHFSTKSFSGLSLIGGGGNIQAQQDTFASFETCVAFTYIPVQVVEPVSVGDFVWFDADADGVQGEGESGIAGVTVTISHTDPADGPVLNVDGSPVTATSIQTDADGRYEFSGLEPGQYTVTVTPPAGYVATVTGQGTGATDSSTGHADSVVLAGGESDPTLDFGFIKVVEPIEPVSVGDFVWFDADADGVQGEGESGIAGVTVTISHTDPADGPVLNVDGSPVTATSIQTDADGRYEFSGLEPGQYTVTVTPPAGYVATVTGQGTGATDSSTGHADSVVLAGGESDPTLDFGFIKASVSVGAYVWLDANKDGLQDGTDVPLKGVVLVLTGPDGNPVTDINGSPVGPQTTDEHGHYSFQHLPVLPAGKSYTVSVDTDASAGALAGLVSTLPGVGTDRSDDSSTGFAASEADLSANGAADLTIDFGFVLADSAPPTEPTPTPTPGAPTPTPSGELAVTGGTGIGMAPWAGAFAAILGILLVIRRSRALRR